MINQRLTLSKKEVADLLGCSVRTLERLRKKRAFPSPIKLGGRVLYRLADIEQFVAAGSMNGYLNAKKN